MRNLWNFFRTKTTTGPAHPTLHLMAVVVPYLWFGLFLLIPLLIILKLSFSESRLAIPPYGDIVSFTQDRWLEVRLNFQHFQTIFADPLYYSAYVNSLRLAFLSALGCLVVGYPLAYFIAHQREGARLVCLTLILLPFWTSFLMRIYAWINLLSLNGFLNTALVHLGLVDGPLHLLHTDGAVCVGIIYCYLPFMILPIYAVLERLDPTLTEAASDLGCPPFQTFWKITLPLSLPGVLTGFMLVFIPAIGEFVIPELLGGADTLVIGKVLWTEFFSNRDWPMASAVAIALLAVVLVPIMIFQQARQNKWFQGDA